MSIACKSRVSVTRKEDARARSTPPFVRPLAASFARQKWRACSQATPIAFLYVRDTSAPQDHALLACLHSHRILKTISDSLFEIFFIKLGGGGKPPPRLASQASLASFWGFLIPLAGKSVPLATETIHCDFCCKILPVKAFTVGTPRKRPPPVSDRDHFLGLTVKHFPLFLTSCKRPLDAFSDPYFRCVHYFT